MSVLTRASAAPASHDVAVAVAALLSNLDTTAPPTLPLEDPESPDTSDLIESTETPECTAVPEESAETQVVAADSPELDRPAEPTGPGPRSLLGPSGLGAAALLLPTSTPAETGLPTIEVPDPARAPTIPAAGLQPPPVALDATPITVGAAQGAAPTGSAPASARGRIPLGPTGLGTASAYLHGSAAPIPPLNCPPPVRDDPPLAVLVNDGLTAWARDIVPLRRTDGRAAGCRVRPPDHARPSG